MFNARAHYVSGCRRPIARANSDVSCRSTANSRKARPPRRLRTRRATHRGARRALAEAEARRANAAADRPKELRGRGGPDPVRYGDWEVKGLATDF